MPAAGAQRRASAWRRSASELTVATYNVHRWTGLNGRSKPDPARAGFVISELDADVIALQEVVRPLAGDDVLEQLAEGLGLHVAFAATRVHRDGELGNAILSRWPIGGVSMLDLSFSRLERRVAVSAQFAFDGGMLDVVATHLALVRPHATPPGALAARSSEPAHQPDAAARRHERLAPAARRRARSRASWRQHHNLDWPASFPAASPVLALDRIYARGARVVELYAHSSRAARRASDHLPIVARVELGD